MTAEQARIGYAAAQQRAEQGHIRHGGIGRVDVFARRALTADRAGGCQQQPEAHRRADDLPAVLPEGPGHLLRQALTAPALQRL